LGRSSDDGTSSDDDKKHEEMMQRGRRLAEEEVMVTVVTVQNMEKLVKERDHRLMRMDNTRDLILVGVEMETKGSERISLGGSNGSSSDDDGRGPHSGEVETTVVMLDREEVRHLEEKETIKTSRKRNDDNGNKKGYPFKRGDSGSLLGSGNIESPEEKYGRLKIMSGTEETTFQKR